MRIFKVQDSLEELKMNVQLWVSDENVNKKSGDLLIALDDFEEQFLKLMDENKIGAQNG